jgi:hypothetical protein
MMDTINSPPVTIQTIWGLGSFTGWVHFAAMVTGELCSDLPPRALFDISKQDVSVRGFRAE